MSAKDQVLAKFPKTYCANYPHNSSLYWVDTNYKDLWFVAATEEAAWEGIARRMHEPQFNLKAASI